MSPISAGSVYTTWKYGTGKSSASRSASHWRAAVPIAAAIVGDDGVSAALVLTARNMAAKRRRTAALDRTHDLELAEAHMAGVGLTPRRSEVAEDIRDFESRTDHEYRFIVADQTFCWLAV